ncbi:MAG TPA: zinc ABC transporter substrate-binding protein, partial [Acidimicrobiaceae bacterium]|nr:zinc ABC transporter substrate-binding protein [Acidimicrobiaceae bacterium]
AGGAAGGAAGRPSVVVTTAIWADVVANVACAGEVDVVSLIPAGGDPHVYEPSLADRSRLDRAALVVVNGLGLEAGLDDTLGTVERAGTPVFRLGDHVETRPPAGGTGGRADDRTGGRAGADPHIWFDPVGVAAALPRLADSLVRHAGVDAAAAEACVARYRAELAALDAELAGTFAALAPADRRLVTNHDSLGYLARRYGFEVVGAVIAGTSTLAAADPAHLAELSRRIERDGVPVVFSEVRRSDDDAVALAAQSNGVRVVPLHTDTLGEPGSGADTYVGLLRTDARLIVDALGAGAGPAGG